MVAVMTSPNCDNYALVGGCLLARGGLWRCQRPAYLPAGLRVAALRGAVREVCAHLPLLGAGQATMTWLGRRGLPETQFEVRPCTKSAPKNC